MKKLWLILSALSFVGAILAYSTQQGFPTLFMLAFIGAVLFIMGILGDNP